MKFKFRVISLFVGCFFSSSVLANASGTGKVKLIGGQLASNSTAVYFGLDPAPTNRAGCNNNADYQFVFDSSTDSGKALYSALLSARATNSNISIHGIGTCIMGFNMEGVSYWISY